ncbi:hypothetical protein CPT_Phriendly_063 [Vibrio phage Phriendly]|nr:hypothetical protein CPT_Phriendly_063 [Vibrio phage Phriendly]
MVGRVRPQRFGLNQNYVFPNKEQSFWQSAPLSILNRHILRNIYSFDGIDDFGSIPPITLEGDFEISLYATADADGNYMTLGYTGSIETWGFYNYSTGNRYFCRFLTSTGVLSLSSAIGTIKPVGEEVHHLVRKTGSLYEYFLNGELANSVTASLGDITVDLIGKRSPANLFWNGNIRDVYFNDLSNPSNSRLYKINEGGGDVMIDSLSSDGSTNGAYNNFNNEGWGRV